jgi:hypothetical protein
MIVSANGGNNSSKNIYLRINLYFLDLLCLFEFYALTPFPPLPKIEKRKDGRGGNQQHPYALNKY